MNQKTFFALLARDLRVLRRNLAPLLLQTLLQPMLFVLIFGRVMVGNGMMNPAFRTVLLPGIIALSMLSSGMQFVALPLMAEFQSTGEIEDRLLAPIEIRWVAIERMLGGMLLAIISAAAAVAGTVLLMGRPSLQLAPERIPELILITLLVALLAAAGGLSIGCTADLARAGLLFSVVISPIIMFGCTYYTWASLAKFYILQKMVLLNPLVYASEALRGALVPEIPHLPLVISVAALVLLDGAMVSLGLHRFHRRALG